MRRALASLREQRSSDDPGEAGASSGAPPLALGNSWGHRKACSRGVAAPPGFPDQSSSAPSTSKLTVGESAHHGLQGTLPLARHQVMKPGPRRLASINSVMERSWQVALEEET
jgi:hypothetical protein